MTWAPQETQKTVFTTLATDDTLIDLLGEDSGTVDTSTKVLDFVPDNKSYPYVTLELKPWNDRGNHTFEGLQAEIQINVWYQPGTSSNTSRGDKPVQDIQNRIDQLLHKQPLCIMGWNTLQLRRTFIDIITEPDNITKHGVQRFQLFLGGI